MKGILAALPGELEAFRSHGREKKSAWLDGWIEEVQPEAFSEPVLICETGVGKVLAAAAAQRVMDLYRIDALIFIGIGGALSKNLRLGDIVIAEACIQYDFSAEAFGFPIGEIPGTGIGEVRSDPVLYEAAMSSLQGADPGRSVYSGGGAYSGRKAVSGRIITGDRFFTTAEKERYLQGSNNPVGDAVDMEGAAAGIICGVNEVPFLLVRIISDTLTGEKPKKFESFVRDQSSVLCTLCAGIVNSLNPLI